MKKLALTLTLLALMVAGIGCDDSPTEELSVKLEAPKISLGEKTPTSVAFSWSPVENAAGYEYSLSAADQVVASQTLPASETRASIDRLTANTAYQLSLRAVGSEMFETSDWATLSFTTPSDQPGPQPEQVEIKDPVLKQYLLDKGIDTDQNGVISPEEAAAFTAIEMGFEYGEDATDQNTVKDLSGLEYFTSLQTLNLKFHRVTDPSPVEGLASLTSLNLGENPISALNLAKLGNLTDLRLYGTQIKELDLTAVPKLQSLYLQRTALTALDLTGLTELTSAFINEAQLSSLKADGLSRLTRLDAVKNKLTQLSVTNCEALTELHLNDNQLSEVTLSGLPKLMRLNLYANKLTSIDLTKMPSLLWIFLYDNQISQIDLKANTALREIYITNNPITELDLSLNAEVEIVEAKQMPQLEQINLKNGYCSDWAEYYIEEGNAALKKVIVDPGYEFEYVSKLFQNRPEVLVTTGEEPSVPKVYVVGAHSNNTAALWIDGVQQDLPDGGISAVANDVYVTASGDIYVVGWDASSTGTARAVLWTNGELTYLSDGTKDVQAKSVAVYGSDVYVAGNEVGTSNTVYLWKNGIPTVLPSVASYAEVGSMAISENGDVYVAGYDNGPVIWKNGVKTGDVLGDASTQLLGIALHGSEVYCSGYRTDENYMYRAMVWQGTQATELTDGTDDCLANAVWVSEAGDVYVAGNQSSSPKKALLWKNGTPETLPADSYKAFDVTGYGGDLYVAGQLSTGSFPFGQQTAVVWKNGVSQSLCDYTSEARAVFVR